MLPPRFGSAALLFLRVLVAALACAACAEESRPTDAPPVCGAPGEARTLDFVDVGEAAAVGASDGVVYLGLRSLRPGEAGAVYRARFDTGTLEKVSGYGGGDVVSAGGFVIHAEAGAAPPEGGSLFAPPIVAIDAATGAPTLLAGSSVPFARLVPWETGVLFQGTFEGTTGVWSWDPRRDPELLSRDSFGALVTAGSELFGVSTAPDPGRTVVSRFDRERGTFVRAFELETADPLIGADRSAFYFADHAARNVRVTTHDGARVRTLGHDLDWTAGRLLARVDDGHVVVADGRVVIRLDGETGEAEELVRYDPATFVTALAADGCHVYAVHDGMRKVTRLPKPGT